MSLPDESGALDLTGHWTGSFSYPRDQEPVLFTAILKEEGEWLGGSTEEVGQVGEAKGAMLTATLQGRRSGRQVQLLKTYDQAFRRYDSVRYVGEVGGDGNEIDGVWMVPGSWSGTFVMVRSGYPYEGAAAKTGETVDAR